MISSLTGQITSIAHNNITLQSNNIGFAVSVPSDVLFTVKQEVTLLIYFHWNQDNGPQLFGFTAQAEKDAFSLIISCSGIGPKMGLLILANMSVDQFFTAITLADIKALSSISGIGTKKAEAMIMHLKDKVTKIIPAQKDGGNKTLIKLKELTEALSSLNYSRIEVNSCMDFVKANFSIETASFDELLRKSLSFLSKRI